MKNKLFVIVITGVIGALAVYLGWAGNKLFAHESDIGNLKSSVRSLEKTDELLREQFTNVDKKLDNIRDLLLKHYETSQ